METLLNNQKILSLMDIVDARGNPKMCGNEDLLTGNCRWGDGASKGKCNVDSNEDLADAINLNENDCEDFYLKFADAMRKCECGSSRTYASFYSREKVANFSAHAQKLFLHKSAREMRMRSDEIAESNSRKIHKSKMNIAVDWTACKPKKGCHAPRTTKSNIVIDHS